MVSYIRENLGKKTIKKNSKLFLLEELRINLDTGEMSHV